MWRCCRRWRAHPAFRMPPPRLACNLHGISTVSHWDQVSTAVDSSNLSSSQHRGPPYCQGSTLPAAASMYLIKNMQIRNYCTIGKSERSVKMYTDRKNNTFRPSAALTKSPHWRGFRPTPPSSVTAPGYGMVLYLGVCVGLMEN